jgi:hypothetical protein
VEDFRQDVEQNYFGTTVVHPVGITVLVILCIAIFLVPRRWIFAPMIVLACFIAPAQRVMLGGFNWDFARILVLAGWLRLLLRREIRPLLWGAMDRCVLWFVVAGVSIYFIRDPTWDAFKYKLGWGYDVVAFYFLLRHCFHGDMDVRRVAAVFATLALPVAVFFAVEFMTRKNIFSVFGGIAPETWIRDGRLRCQGAFAHPIIAGVFWAASFPIIATGLWSKRPGARLLAVAGLVGATVIVLASNSSTSVAALLTAIVAMAAFPIRSYMPTLQVLGIITTFALHMVMKAPVWHLVARASAYDSSTGYHRYLVINEAIRHFDEWWLVGIGSTAHWEVEDITNEFVFTGIEGGFLTLLFLLAIVFFAFREVGRAWRRDPRNRTQVWLTWLLGVTLFVHVSTFIGLSYFGQVKMLWQLGLAMIASLASSAQAPVPQRVVRVQRVTVSARARAPAGDAGDLPPDLPDVPPDLPGAPGRAAS